MRKGGLLHHVNNAIDEQAVQAIGTIVSSHRPAVEIHFAEFRPWLRQNLVLGNQSVVHNVNRAVDLIPCHATSNVLGRVIELVHPHVPQVPSVGVCACKLHVLVRVYV